MVPGYKVCAAGYDPCGSESSNTQCRRSSATSPLSKGLVSFATSYGQVSFVYSSLVDTKIRDGGIVSPPIPCGQYSLVSNARAVKTFHEINQ